MDHINFLSWCSTEKKKETLWSWELTNISPLSTLLRPKFFELWKGKTSMYSVSRRLLPQGTTSAAKFYACAESILWVIKTAKRPMKSSYSYRTHYYQSMYRNIYRPMSRPIYWPMCRAIYRPIYGWSTGEASVKYRWTPTISTDRSFGRHQTDISTDTQPSIDRVAVDTRPILGRVSVEKSTDIGIETSVAAPHKILNPFSVVSRFDL